METLMTNHLDIIDQSVPLLASDSLHALRRERIKIVDATQGSYAAMFDPAVTGVSVAERLLIAQHACRISGANSLAAHYGSRLQEESSDASSTTNTARVAALLAFTEKLIRKPIDGDQTAVQALLDAGFEPPALVAVGQLIAFLSYQIRLTAGLQALKAAGAEATPSSINTTEGLEVSTRSTVPLLPNPIRIKGFTTEALDWHSWIEPLRLEDATPEQLAAIEAMSPTAKNQQYFRMLAHQPEMLLQRSIAFNAIMFAPGGMPRSERELGATVESRLNGCVYCASVHAQRFEQLTKRNDVIAQLWHDPSTAGTTPRERAVIALSAALALQPSGFNASHIQAVRAEGLTDAETLDLIHAVALFAWANRLMLNLGEPYCLDGTLAQKGQI
jgi:uncharacterized peroxidase-related enzyme